MIAKLEVIGGKGGGAEAMICAEEQAACFRLEWGEDGTRAAARIRR